MRFINILVAIVTFANYAIGGDAYTLVDIDECILPISNKLYKKRKGVYLEKNHTVSLYVHPTSIVLEKINQDTERIAAKAKSMLHLDKKIIISGFQVFTDGRKINSVKWVYLKDHTLLIANYPEKDLKYMLSYCRETDTED